MKVVDLIPRQSAMNVNEFQATRSIGHVAGILNLISGIGAKVNFERRRELYEQFLYQDTFASGFGKGTTSFGWRFGSLPGEKQISPGLRNTYAVVSVPEDAVALELEVYGCGMRQNQSELLQTAPESGNGDCTSVVTQFVALPQKSFAREVLTVDRIRYNSVAPGGRVTILIEGKNFGPQTALIADGVALDRAISVTDMGLPPLARKRDALLANGATRGTFEIVNRSLISVSLECKPEFESVPDLIIQTPETAVSVRDSALTEVIANGRLITAREWWDAAPIYKHPPSPKLAIKSADLRLTSSTGMEAIVLGVFPSGTTFRVNGAPVAPVQLEKRFAILEFPKADIAEWSFVALHR